MTERIITLASDSKSQVLISAYIENWVSAMGRGASPLKFSKTIERIIETIVCCLKNCSLLSSPPRFFLTEGQKNI